MPLFKGLFYLTYIIKNDIIQGDSFGAQSIKTKNLKIKNYFMSAHAAAEHSSEQKRKKNKFGLYLVLAFVVITIAAMFTNGFGLFSSKEKDGDKSDFSYFEKGTSAPERTDAVKKRSGEEEESESKITVTGEQPSENNISIPPGCTYKIKTSVPVTILFEDADGNQVEDVLRPGEEKNFPQMTPLKVWRQKPGQSIVKVTYSEKN